MSEVKITWLGHSTFKITTPEGRILIIDPWLKGNPSCPQHLKTLDHVDGMLITHGHTDHMGDALTLYKDHSVKTVAFYETAIWLEKKGIESPEKMNFGGTINFLDTKVTCVKAEHSAGIPDGDDIVYGGEPCGFIIKLSNGMTIYHAGDTNVFADMQLISKLYKPDIAMLPIGGRFTMGGKEAALAARMLKSKAYIPMHYGTFQALPGTLRNFKDEMDEVEGKVMALEIGEEIVLSPKKDE